MNNLNNAIWSLHHSFDLILSAADTLRWTAYKIKAFICLYVSKKLEHLTYIHVVPSSKLGYCCSCHPKYILKNLSQGIIQIFIGVCSCNSCCQKKINSGQVSINIIYAQRIVYDRLACSWKLYFSLCVMANWSCILSWCKNIKEGRLNLQAPVASCQICVYSCSMFSIYRWWLI
jgi:hypothetical protein